MKFNCYDLLYNILVCIPGILLAAWWWFFGGLALVVDYHIGKRGIETRLFRNIIIRTIPFEEINEIRYVSPHIGNFSIGILKPFTFLYGVNRVSLSFVLIETKHANYGFIKKIIISPNNPTEFVAKVQSRISSLSYKIGQ